MPSKFNFADCQSHETRRLVTGHRGICVFGDCGREFCGGSVEFLTEFRDVQTVLTERRTDRRGGVRFTGGNLQLNLDLDFLGHRNAGTDALAADDLA